MNSIFKGKAREKRVNITDLWVVKVLITRLLRQELSRLVREIKLIKL
jgi:hypothetical protein